MSSSRTYKAHVSIKDTQVQLWLLPMLKTLLGYLVGLGATMSRSTPPLTMSALQQWTGRFKAINGVLTFSSGPMLTPDTFFDLLAHPHRGQCRDRVPGIDGDAPVPHLQGAISTADASDH